eukprot:2510689-Amphidinium_carterae.1
MPVCMFAGIFHCFSVEVWQVIVKKEWSPSRASISDAHFSDPIPSRLVSSASSRIASSRLPCCRLQFSVSRFQPLPRPMGRRHGCCSIQRTAAESVACLKHDKQGSASLSLRSGCSAEPNSSFFASKLEASASKST